MAIYGRALGGGGGGGSDLLIYTGSAETPPADKPAGIYAVTDIEPDFNLLGFQFLPPQEWESVSKPWLSNFPKIYYNGKGYRFIFSGTNVVLQEIDLETGAKTQLASMGGNQSYNQIIPVQREYNGYLYYCAGSASSSSTTAIYLGLYKYDFSTNTISYIGGGGSYHGVGCCGGYFGDYGVVAGGRNSNNTTLIDFSQETMIANSNTICAQDYGTTCFYANGLFHFIGGSSSQAPNASDEFSNKHYTFDPLTRTRGTATNFPRPVSYLFSYPFSDTQVLVGWGHVYSSPATYEPLCYYYDAVAGGFNTAPSLPTTRGSWGNPLTIMLGSVLYMTEGVNFGMYAFTMTGADSQGNPILDGTLAIDVSSSAYQATIIDSKNARVTVPVYKAYIKESGTLSQCTAFARIMGGEWEQVSD